MLDSLRFVRFPQRIRLYRKSNRKPALTCGYVYLSKILHHIIAASGCPFPYEIALYVNDEGLYGCTPNRAVFATGEMAEAGCLSEIDGSRLGEGDLAAVIFGRAVAVGFDPATGEDVDLTDEQAELVKRTFSESGPSRSCSGVLAVMRIQMGIDVAAAGA